LAKAYEWFGNTLVYKILQAMERKGYVVDGGLGQVNIVYIEGLSVDGSPNDNRPNWFNDLRCCIVFQADGPIIHTWEATTEPGRRYTVNPINSGGAARIAFGQYRAWQVGMHRGDHEALVQTGGPVSVHRDLNKDYERTGDRVDTGYFGINQHWGYDLPVSDIGPSSAGCLVGRTKKGHKEFMSIVKSDPRYRLDNRFIFRTAVLSAKDLV
jgi:hypothetical protein